MKIKEIFCLLLLFIISTAISQAQEQFHHFPVLKGPYLGQNPPGMTPQLFAPEIFKTEVHGALVISPDGREMYWDLMEEVQNILCMKIENNQWTKPAEVSFKSHFGTGNATFSPDGKKLFFTSRESIEGGKKGEGENIWYVDRQNNSWGKPKPLGPVVNSYPLHWQVSVASNGNLYFSAGGDIYVALPQKEKYNTVRKMGAAINTEHYESTPYIAPNESYMIFSRFGGDLRYADLFICFKDPQGNWTEAINMGTQINSEMHELCPDVTPDGKYLFFNRNYGEKGDLRIFWVSSKIIVEIKSQVLK